MQGEMNTVYATFTFSRTEEIELLSVYEVSHSHLM